MKKTLMSAFLATVGLLLPCALVAEDTVKQPLPPTGPSAELGEATQKAVTIYTRIVADGENTLTLTTKNGQEDHLQVMDKTGKAIFDGPVATEAQLAKLPAGIAVKLERLQQKITITDDEEPAPAKEVKPDRPENAALLAAAIHRAMEKKEYKDNPNVLNLMAWSMVDPEVPVDKPDLNLALEVAQRANELAKGESGEILDTLARVHFMRGEVDKAIALQTKAVEKSAATDKEKLQKTLSEYQAKKSSLK